MTDYETAMRNAISIQYLNFKLRACWFHYCQAVKKNALRIGFVQLIRTNELERDIYYKLMCLPLLPENMIENAFKGLKQKSERIESLQFINFMKYFERQWITLVRISVYIQHFRVNDFMFLLLRKVQLTSVFSIRAFEPKVALNRTTHNWGRKLDRHLIFLNSPHY